MSIVLSNEVHGISYPLDLISNHLASTLSDVADTVGSPITDDFITFAQQQHDTGLTLCGADDFEDMNGGTPIGHGATFTVFKCWWRSRRRAVAVKRLNLGVPLGASSLAVHEDEYRGLLKSLFLELRVMKHPWFRAHPNIVDLLALTWDHVPSADVLSSYRPSLIVELADETTPTLKHLVEGFRRDGIEDEPLLFLLLADAAEGLEMLHQTRIVHGDFKPENVLLFATRQRLVAKLSDFGFCAPFVDGTDRIGGTLYWNAPECLPGAPESIKSFVNCYTRDLYSYGLVMWYCLFRAMPWNAEESGADAVASDWKLNQNPKPALEKNIREKNEGADLLLPQENATPHDLLWIQIRSALLELLKRRPDSRKIRLGDIHLVLQQPDKLDHCRAILIRADRGSRPDDVFLPRGVRQHLPAASCRVDSTSGFGYVRPGYYEAMSAGLTKQTVSRYNPYRLHSIPRPLQECIFREWESMKEAADTTSSDYTDLLLVLASCYRAGFGTAADTAAADDLDLAAAELGFVVGQIKCLLRSVCGVTEQPRPEAVELAWLKEAMGIICFAGKNCSDEIKTRFRESLDVVDERLIRPCLLITLIGSQMTDWEIYPIGFDGAAEDTLFGLVILGDALTLAEALSSDGQLLHRRKAGFTLLHVAADYCQVEVIQDLIQTFGMSPDVKADSGDTAIELAASAGSIECVQLLLSLGANPRPLADQELFTEVAMTGARDTAEQTAASGTRKLLSLILSTVKMLHLRDSHAERKPQVAANAAVQALLDGRYYTGHASSPTSTADAANDVPPPLGPDAAAATVSFPAAVPAVGTPLEACISIANYDSVFALLDLGADPNADSCHLPPLHVAVVMREPVLAALLLAHGAAVDARAPAGAACGEFTPLHQASSTAWYASYEPPRSSGSVRLRGEPPLADDGGDRFPTAAAAITAVRSIDSDAAVVWRTQACAAALLCFGADIDARDSRGATPLMQRVDERDAAMAQFLVDRGADVQLQTPEGTVLCEAAGFLELLAMKP